MKKVLAGAAAALIALPFIIAGAALPETDAVYKGVLYIETTQQPDGGFGGFGPGQTMDAIFAIRSAGVDPNVFENGGNTPADYIVANAGSAATAAEAAKAAMGAVAAGLDPRDVAGVDLIAVVEAAYDEGTGAYAADDFSQAIVVLGLARAGEPVPAGALDSLRANQLDDGGWGFGASDPDTTAIVLQALIAGGGSAGEPAAVEAIAYLQATQNGDGGWGYDGASNTSSTAYAVQALLAAAEDPESATYVKGGETPISYLLALQQPDGSFPGFDPAFATNQVVPALAGKAFIEAPAVTVTVTALPSRTPTATATTPATATATVKAPLAPNTGSGHAAGDEAGGTSIVVVGALFALAGGGLLLAARRR